MGRFVAYRAVFHSAPDNEGPAIMSSMGSKTITSFVFFAGTALATPASAQTIEVPQRTMVAQQPGPMAATLAQATSKQTQWAAFLRKSGLSSEKRFEEVVQDLREFLVPMIDAIRRGEAFDRRWEPGGPWR